MNTFIPDREDAEYDLDSGAVTPVTAGKQMLAITPMAA